MSRFTSSLIVLVVLAVAGPLVPPATAQASLSLTLSDAPDPVLAGANLTYTLTANNEGPSDAANASVSDPLPAGTTFVAVSAPAGWTCTTPAFGAVGTVSCSIDPFPVGSAVFTLTVQVGPGVAAGTILSNTATITSTTFDPSSDDNSDTATTTVGAAPGNLSLTIADSPDPVVAGGSLTYTLAVTSSLADAADGTLTVPVPVGTTFQSFTPAAGWSCGTPAAGGTGSVVCTNPTPPAPGTDVFTLVVRVGTSFQPGATLTTPASLTLTTSGRDVTASDSAPTVVIAALAQVPTLDGTGLALLTLSLAAGGLVLLRRPGQGAAG